MIFKIKDGKLESTTAVRELKELEIEKLIAGDLENPHEIEDFSIFKESIFYLGRQRVLEASHRGERRRSRLDMICIDRLGRGIIVELKRDSGYLGMETQALYYLAQIFPLKGNDFLRFALGREPTSEHIQSIEEFCECKIEDINQESRIILVAQNFDPALFSLGNWFAHKSCDFKAISYYPTRLGEELVITFSSDFQSYNRDSFGLQALKQIKSQNKERKGPSVYWHNIGKPEDSWWQFLIKSGLITASFDNLDRPDSRGYIILNQYVEGDKIIAFAGGYGAVGVGVISKGSKYAYKNHEIPEYFDQHYHTREVKWLAHLPLAQAISANEIHEKFGLNHPSQTKQEIRQDTQARQNLIEEIERRAKKLLSKAG